MKKGKEFIKIILCFCVLFLTTLSANAINNSLTGIDVKQNAKDGYNIILKLAGKTNIKKIISSNDSLALVLNSTVPSDTMEIIYDNTSDINNVIVQKKNKDNTIVVVEGKNIANASIYTKDISSGTISEFSEKNYNYDMLPIGIFALGFLAMVAYRRKTNKKRNIINNHINGKINTRKTTPNIAYNTQKSFVSAPKDFVINRYMEGEKIRKAS